MESTVRLPLHNERQAQARLADWQQPHEGTGPVRVMSSPRSVDLAITGKCNLRCKTCYYADEMVALANMPTIQWLKLIEELGDMRVMSVLLTGGEPMTHPDIFQLIDAIVQNRMRFRMNSNGMLFTEETAGRIRESGRCDTIQISIDGSRPEIHDQIRGNGSFVRAIRGIRILQSAGIPVSVRVTINRINFRDLPDIFRLLIEELDVKSVGTNESFPRGAAHCNLESLDMTPEERRECERICIEFADIYPGITAMAGPLVLGRRLKAIDEDMKKPEVAREPPRGGYLSGCGVAHEALSVMHDGKVVPCLQLPHMVLGRAGVDPLKKIWDESVGLHYLRTRRGIPLGQLEECRDCKYQQYCTGGCPAIAYAVTGKTTGRDPRSCYRALKGEDPQFVF